MSARQNRWTAVEVVVRIVVTGVVGLGLGWVIAALFGEPPSERWDRALGLAAPSTLIALINPLIGWRRSRRETVRGNVLAGVRVEVGDVPGLRSRWTLGRVSVTSGRVDFVAGRVPFRRRSRPDVTLVVGSHDQPRDSTFRESLRVGGDARVVRLVTTHGARVLLAAIHPASMPPMMEALDS